MSNCIYCDKGHCKTFNKECSEKCEFRMTEKEYYKELLETRGIHACKVRTPEGNVITALMKL